MEVCYSRTSLYKVLSCSGCKNLPCNKPLYITLQITIILPNLDDRRYVAFGSGGYSKKTRMTGANVAVDWLDRSTGKGFVLDHFISSKTLFGSSCQDSLSARGSNNIWLLNAAGGHRLRHADLLTAFKLRTISSRRVVGQLNSENEPTYHKLRNKGEPHIVIECNKRGDGKETHLLQLQAIFSSISDVLHFGTVPLPKSRPQRSSIQGSVCRPRASAVQQHGEIDAFCTESPF